jgi:hypothetical protein
MLSPLPLRTTTLYRSTLRRAICVGCALAMLGGTATIAVAAESTPDGAMGNPARQLATTAPAPRREPQLVLPAVLARIAAVEADPNAKVVAEPLSLARAALERGNRLRGAGDVVRAQLTLALASEWVSLAEVTLVRAQEAAKRAAAERDAVALGVRAEQERSRAEAAIMRISVVSAQLREAESKQVAQKTKSDGAAAARADRERHGAPQRRQPIVPGAAPSDGAREERP